MVKLQQKVGEIVAEYKYKKGDIVMYKRDVCRVVRIGESDYTGEKCYILVPTARPDGSIKMQVPVSNKSGHLRDLITRDEIRELIRKTPDVETLVSKPANMKSQYAALMHSDDVLDLDRIIKTSYERNQERIASHKKLASIDDEYLRRAEKYLYNEISASTGMSFDESKEYFESEVKKEEAGRS